MADADASKLGQGKFTGLAVDLIGLGKNRLTELISEHGETSVYRAAHPGVVVKMFDLECGKPDEVSYGPYVAFNLERENFQDIDAIAELKRSVPAFYGANIDFEKKYAYITMEYFPGENLREWCQVDPGNNFDAWADQLRAANYETLAIVTRFHENGIFLIDFKPDNVIRMPDGRIRFVDLGAFFTPRHSRETDKYAYSATPDYAELVIDTSNVQTGLPLNQCSDIFAAGVAFFEMTTGRSRVAIADATAEQILNLPELYRFRDSQIRDVWHAYPHLKDVLPLVEVQLREREILFAEIWYLIKGLLSHEIPDWEKLPELRRQELILETGISLIADQLPWKLDWLSQAIARATTLRSLRLKTVPDLMRLVASPLPVETREQILQGNGVVHHLQDVGLPVDFLQDLNTWEVRCNEATGNWALLAVTVGPQLGDTAPFTFLKRVHRDKLGHSFYQIVSDLEADPFQEGALTLAHVAEDHFAWVGA
jgi:serine/threonine protein kinase